MAIAHRPGRTRLAYWPCQCGAFGKTTDFHCTAGHRRDEVFVAGYRRGQEALRNHGAARSPDERKRYEQGIKRAIEDMLVDYIPDNGKVQ